MLFNDCLSCHSSLSSNLALLDFKTARPGGGTRAESQGAGGGGSQQEEGAGRSHRGGGQAEQ